jgi:3-hydroxy-3-methylglutaryl CoA synthase
MIGITSYGAYVPLWRLNRKAISGESKGEKAVANFDEDSITMAVAAGMNCLESKDLGVIDGLFFASTTSPYKEKLASSIVAAALDIDSTLFTVDLANSLRAGTAAMKLAFDSVKAGSRNNVMVIASDCRLGAPGSAFERDCGDGAAAIVIGDKDVAVSIEDSHSTSNFLLDVWRANGDKFIRSWEERFIVEEGYLKIINEAVTTVMNRLNLTPKDFSKAVFYSPDARRGIQIVKQLGFNPETQMQPLLFDVMGNTGAAYSLMLLIGALEEAIPGDRILLVGYGDGSDVFVLKVTEHIEKLRGRKGIKWHLKSKKLVPDYKTYLQWREILTLERFSRPVTGPISVSALWRDQQHALPLHGGQCKVCGTIQYPPQIVCTKCHSKDQFAIVRLANKEAELVTYSLDYLSTGPEPPPIVVAVVDFDGGGRMLTMMTDRDINEVKIGMKLGMSFRKLFSYEGVHNYFWKSMPLRGQ